LNVSQRSKTTGTVYATFAAAVLFFIHLITYFIPSLRDATTSSSVVATELLTILGVAEHLLLFPAVDALPAPRWAKAAGYGWLVIDIATEIMGLGGVAKVTYLSLRYGGHISAAIWIASASWQEKGAMRIVGYLLALDLVIYSFTIFVPFAFVILIPSLVLLPLWIVFVGRLIGGDKEQLEEDTNVSTQQNASTF
jgi:hypothetical protein